MLAHMATFSLIRNLTIHICFKPWSKRTNLSHRFGLNWVVMASQAIVLRGYSVII